MKCFFSVIDSGWLKYYSIDKNHLLYIRTDSCLEGGDDKMNYFKCYSQSVNMVKVNIACSFAIQF